MSEKHYLTMRLHDLMIGKKQEEEKSAEEIIAYFRSRIEEDAE